MHLAREINELQTDTDFDQDIPLQHLKSLVRLGVLVHVQTTVINHGIHRYFVPVEDAHDYVVNDLRTDHSEELNPVLVDQVQG